MPSGIFKLTRSKKGNYFLKMDKGTMSVFQNTVRRAFDFEKLSDIDKIILRSIHDYCWAWNKLDPIINGGVMNKDLNGHGEFFDIVEKELEWWSKDKGIDLNGVTALKCARCGSVVDRIDVIRFLELKSEPHCSQCPGQGFDGKRLKLVPVKPGEGNEEE